MKALIVLAGLCAVSCASPLLAADSAGAMLHCDPAVTLKAVDDDPVEPPEAYEYCAVPLPAGDHWLNVCYDASRTGSAGGYLVQRVAVCDKDKVVNMKAEPGHIYRLKLDLVSPQWKAWIEDVTATEANLPAGTKGSKPAHKGEGKVTLVMHMTPTNGRVGVANGSTQGVWFREGTFGSMPMKGNGEDGFISKKASGGDTFAVTTAWMPRGDSIFNSAAAVACGDTKIPVYEDIPGGRALYLGEFSYRQSPKGVTLQVKQEGLEAARAWLAKNDAKLAATMELANARWLRTPTICLDVSAEGRLMNAAP
jgi:hypothetical protein